MAGPLMLRGAYLAGDRDVAQRAWHRCQAALMERTPGRIGAYYEVWWRDVFREHGMPRTDFGALLRSELVPVDPAAFEAMVLLLVLAHAKAG